VVQRVHPSEPAPGPAPWTRPAQAGLVGCDSRTRPVAAGDPALGRRCGVEVRARSPSAVVATRQSSTDPTTAVLRRAPRTVTAPPAVARTSERARPTRSTSCRRAPEGSAEVLARPQRAPQRDGSRPAAGARRTTPRARSCSQDGSPAPGDRPPPAAGASPASGPSTSRGWLGSASARRTDSARSTRCRGRPVLPVGRPGHASSEDPAARDTGDSRASPGRQRTARGAQRLLQPRAALLEHALDGAPAPSRRRRRRRR